MKPSSTHQAVLFRGLHPGRFLVLTALVFLGGFVSADTSLPAPMRANLKQIRIVALEPIPLQLPMGYNSIVPLPGLAGSQVTGVVGILGILAGPTPEASKLAGEASQSAQKALKGEGAWIPTMVLANEVKAQLEARGIAATVSPDLKLIPGVKDHNSYYSGLIDKNWRAPISAWYNDPGSAPDSPSTATDQSTCALEIGTKYYSVAGQQLYLGVVIKVSDPSTGRVIGRTQALGSPFSLPNLNPLEKAFANGGAGFKQAFSDESHKLVTKCLANLGLVP